MTARQSWRLGLGVAVAALFIWLTLRHIDGARIAQVMRAVRPEPLLASTALLCVGYACRIARWRTMLARGNPALRFMDCAGPLLASYAANNVLPFRAGDLMRSFAFNQRMGTTAGAVLATVFVERLLDMLMMIVLLALALWVFHFDVARLLGIGTPLLLLAAGAILSVLLYPRLLQPPIALLGLLARRLPAAGRLQAELSRATLTLGQLAGGSTLPQLLAWSAAAWLIEGSVYWIVAQSLPAITVPLAAWLAAPVGTLATLIPSTPGYVGTFDFFAAQAMVQAGNDTTAAAAFAFLVHILLWLPGTVAGGLYMLFRPAQVSVAGP